MLRADQAAAASAATAHRGKGNSPHASASDARGKGGGHGDETQEGRESQREEGGGGGEAQEDHRAPAEEDAHGAVEAGGEGREAEARRAQEHEEGRRQESHPEIVHEEGVGEALHDQALHGQALHDEALGEEALHEEARRQQAARLVTTCLVVGAGVGLGAAFARVFRNDGFEVALAARDPAKLAPVCEETGAHAFACNATKEQDVLRLFDAVEKQHGLPQLVIYNASTRVRGGVAELQAADVERTLAVTAFGGFLVGREAARRLLPQGSGAIFFTGASASVKGYA